MEIIRNWVKRALAINRVLSIARAETAYCINATACLKLCRAA